MLRRSIAALLLVAACCGHPYPRFETVVRDPALFDLMFSTTAGVHNETWYFGTQVNVTNFIIPTQMDWSSGPETNGTYTEDVELLVYQLDLSSGSGPVLVGNGSYTGAASMGQALRIPVRNATNGEELSLGVYISAANGFSYILSFLFRTTGMYPWYTSRAFAAYTPLLDDTDGEGLALGLTFSYA